MKHIFCFYEAQFSIRYSLGNSNTFYCSKRGKIRAITVLTLY
uniref:Uncharacterized protein n=1 Tax=Arundo donax TaxID=35708 RepID=A0A0A8YNE8_ARUDO